MRFIWLILSFLLLSIGGFVFLKYQQGSYEQEVLTQRKSLLSLADTPFKDDKNIFRADFSVSPPEQAISHLTGTSITAPSHTNEFVIGVMIDNATPARAGQTGFDKAPVVIEALAEGGVTRFLALFSSYQDISIIGPVRSTRPYFFDFIRPLHGILAHAGGSDQVLAELFGQNEIFDLDNERIGDETFWRNTDLNKPHNLFTSTENVFSHLLSQEKTDGLAPLSSDVFVFSAPPSRLPISQVMTDFSYPAYRAVWQWNEDKGVFERNQSRSPLEIEVHNLIVLEADMWKIEDDPKGRMGMKNTGSGKIMTFQNGQMISGTWQKSSRSDDLTFFDAEGGVLPFIKGKTWIAVLDDFDKVSVE